MVRQRRKLFKQRVSPLYGRRLQDGIPNGIHWRNIHKSKQKKKLYQHSVDLLYKFERTKSSSDHYHYLINASFIRRENDSLRHNALKVH